MHDPQTVSFNIYLPIPRNIGDWGSVKVSECSLATRCYLRLFGLKVGDKFSWHQFGTIWHTDPERDGTDDSCGWFMRCRHGDKAMLDKIEKRFEWDWDRVFNSESGGSYFCGFFKPTGEPHLSVHAIVLNLFFLATLEVFGTREKAMKFCQKNLFDILLFAENPFDSISDSITLKFGNDAKRKDRIHNMASTIYGWILREQRPWWKHPRYHLFHVGWLQKVKYTDSSANIYGEGWQWKVSKKKLKSRNDDYCKQEIAISIPWPVCLTTIQIHCLQMFKRWAFTKCNKCGKRVGYTSNVVGGWNSTGPRWFRSENVEGPCCSHIGGPVEAKKA